MAERAEQTDIQRLNEVGGMRRQAKQFDVVSARKLQESERFVAAMAIQKEESFLAILKVCANTRFEEILEPFEAQGVVNPSIGETIV